MAGGHGYGVRSIPVVGAGRGSTPNSGVPDATDHTPLTDGLGCTEMRVDAHQLGRDDAIELGPGQERIALTLGDSGVVELDGRFGIPPSGIGRLPPARPWRLAVDNPASLLVVSTRTSVDDGVEPTILDLSEVEYRTPSTSDVATAFLTTSLGCTGVKVNARRLEPGQAVPYHTEGTQEELFVPLGEGAAMRIEGEQIPTPIGTVVRVAPETPRSAITDGDAATRWLMFGAPPTGGPTAWDPGATIVE